jgi:hypothetical protein
MQAPLAAFAGIGRNVQAIATEITKITQENIEAGAKAIEKLREVKSLPDVFSVQTELMQASLETFGAHGPRIAEIAASTPAEVMKSYQEALGQIAEAGGAAARKASDTTQSMVEQTTSAARNMTNKATDAARSTTR